MFFKSNRKMKQDAAPLVLNVAPVPGFFAGTEVATRYAWTKVEELSVGDTVLTAENGEQMIMGIERGSLTVASHAAAAGQWPLLVPEGALGNEKALMLSPGMRIVIEDEVAGALFGQPCVSVRAETLIGYRGIARARVGKTLEHVTLVFDKPQTVVAEGGLFFDVPDAKGVNNFLPLNDRQSRLLLRQLSHADREQRTRKVASGWI
ncbi:MAG: Hint domain-containing protein [Pseudomonadota bacterium]